MTQNIKRKARPEYIRGLLHGIIITGAALAAAIYGPKAVKSLDKTWQDYDYAQDHAEMKQIKDILTEREINSRGYTAKPDSYEDSLRGRLNYLEKRHEAEKKNAACHYCDERQHS